MKGLHPASDKMVQVNPFPQDGYLNRNFLKQNKVEVCVWWEGISPNASGGWF